MLYIRLVLKILLGIVIYFTKFYSTETKILNPNLKIK